MSPSDDRPRDPADAGLVLTEEEAHVSVRAYPYERVRIAKRVVTEVREVEVRREELVVERVPVDGADADAFEADAGLELGAGDHIDLELRYEEVELVTRLVPFERVRVRRERVQRDVSVDATLRVERAEVDER